MSELKKNIYDEKNGLHYTLIEDYYIPDLNLPEEHRPIGKYGRMHREYLREVHPVKIEHIDTDRGVMDIPCRPERTGTGTIRHYHGADESYRGRDRGIKAYLSNGMGTTM